MATAYVIHAEGDMPFVKQWVLQSLPSNGYDYWLARHHFSGVNLEEHVIAQAMDQCQVILIVLSLAILRSATSFEEIDIALAGRRTLIVVQIADLDEQDGARLPARLWALPKVDLTVEEEAEAVPLLLALLPPVDGTLADAETPKDAEHIEWNEGIFSTALASATERHDHARADSLVAAIVGHFVHRPYAYPPQYAYEDLQKLRQEREFELMSRYAEAAVASGTHQDRVRRLFAQALIETKEYERALEVLQSIIDEPGSSRNEVFEAHGLVGRTFKQQYVDAPNAPGSAELLQRAIAAYESVYVRDSSQFWHGVNAASCILRAERDGIAAAPPGRAQEIAQQIVEDLDRLSQAGPLNVWDCASRIEALLTLERYEDAEQAVDVYLRHPDMTAFEVSSTFRQFDQVLELGRTQRGQAILARLRVTVERYRAPVIAASPVRGSLTAESVPETAPTRPLIIRVGDTSWDPRGVTDLVIQARLGKIVTARGSKASVRALLADSRVISVEESRPAGNIECERSMPFIKIAAEYANAAGKYTETGDRALIAIVDNGIDVLHKAFLDANGNSRIVGIWDQTASGGTPPAGFSFGTFHDATTIAGYLKASAVPPGLGRNDHGHGTHVASIAGGRAAGNFAGGVAPDAKLLMVVSGGSGPIGYSQSHIEALTFIDAVATELKMPVVVNLSQGMNAGAHDGKSSLEVAFDAFSDSGRRQGRVVVKSAGNERAKAGHALVTMLPKSLERLRWKRPEGADLVERIELWWSSADEIKFQLRDPFGNLSSWVGTTAPECEGTFPKGGSFHLVFTKRHVDNGDSLLLIELGSATAPAAFGEWVLEMESTEVPEGGEIHCWLERSLGVPSSFLTHASEDMTLSIPGTASSVIAVGAVDASMPIQVGGFSSYGPTRDQQKKPLVCAPGVNVYAAQGGTAEGVFRDSGTSMAAPHATGAIALLLSRTAKSGKIPSGNQIASALRQKTQNYNGRWDRGQGYGVIDVAALLTAFD